MSKYYLVASYYNLRTNTYERETIIDALSGEKLNALSKIDSFTSNYTTTEILKLIEQERGLFGFNQLSIMYLKNKSASPTYYRIIDSDQRFNNCLKASKQATNNILGKQKNTIYINRNNELYKEELENLLKIIQSKNYDLFKSIYPYNNDFSFLVERYINTSYDTASSKEEDLKQILVEFCRYKTFRGWYLLQKKIKSNISFENTSKKKIEPVIKNDQPKKVVVHSIAENEKQFEKRFIKEQGLSYSSYNTNQYNMEKEEFLSEDEYESMNSYDEEDNKTLGRRH